MRNLSSFANGSTKKLMTQELKKQKRKSLRSFSTSEAFFREFLLDSLAGAASSSESYFRIASFRALAGRRRTTVLALILMASPV